MTINKANAVAATVTANNRTYDGTEKPLATVTGEATGGEMQYALGTATEATEQYTTSIPTATNAGTYYVWYKAAGDEDHRDSNAASVTVTISAGSYFIYSTNGTVHTLGDGSDAVITVKREGADPYVDFNGVSVDQGGALNLGTQFTKAQGSLVLTLKASYLNTLAVGDHTVHINFKDGSVDAKLTIVAPPEPPKTGDSSNPMLWLALILLGILGIGGITFAKRNR